MDYDARVRLANILSGFLAALPPTKKSTLLKEVTELGTILRQPDTRAQNISQAWKDKISQQEFELDIRGETTHYVKGIDNAAREMNMKLGTFKQYLSNGGGSFTRTVGGKVITVTRRERIRGGEENLARRKQMRREAGNENPSLGLKMPKRRY